MHRSYICVQLFFTSSLVKVCILKAKMIHILQDVHIYAHPDFQPICMNLSRHTNASNEGHLRHLWCQAHTHAILLHRGCASWWTPPILAMSNLYYHAGHMAPLSNGLLGASTQYIQHAAAQRLDHADLDMLMWRSHNLEMKKLVSTHTLLLE